MPPAELKGNPAKEYVSLGRIGYGGSSTKKPKFDPSAGRDYDADAAELPENRSPTPVSARGKDRNGKKTAANTEASAEPVIVVPIALSPAQVAAQKAEASKRAQLEAEAARKNRSHVKRKQFGHQMSIRQDMLIQQKQIENDNIDFSDFEEELKELAE